VPAQVLIHELAHKLDMLDGYSNGHPPLHASMDEQVWHDAFEAAYLHLRHRVETGHQHELDSYGATSPAEFFAVCSEYFFAAPGRLHKEYPDVYRQLSLFYNQQPVPGKSVTSPSH
jgi:Mlc titration factor MtfA (ptsG expression regulator)